MVNGDPGMQPSAQTWAPVAIWGACEYLGQLQLPLQWAVGLLQSLGCIHQPCVDSETPLGISDSLHLNVGVSS